MLANSVSATVSGAMDRAGVPGTPHAALVRHQTARPRSGPVIIKEFMGHQSMVTTATRGRPLHQRAQAINLLLDILGDSI